MTDEPACTHHWMIESPNGLEQAVEVEGRCKLCGTTRMFKVAAAYKGYGQRIAKPTASVIEGG